MKDAKEFSRLGGVCGGIADYFAVDATLVRIAFVVLAIFSLGFGAVLLYGLLWAIMPEAGPDAPAPAGSGAAPNRSLLLGIVLIVFGVALLFQRMQMFWWLHWGLGGFGWPLLLLAGGVLIIVASRRR